MPLLICLLAVALFTADSWATTDEYSHAPVGELLPEDAVNIAVADNPNLAAMQSRFEAASAIPTQVGTLPDPMVSFSAASLPTDTFDVKQEAMTQMQFGVSQQIPFPGKLALMEEASGFEAAAIGNDVDETRLRLVKDVLSSWWTLHYLDQALVIVDQNQTLLKQFVEITKTKYEVGRGLQQDVLLAQLELSRLFDTKIQLIGRRRGEAAGLNRLMGRLADTTVILPTVTSRDLPRIADEGVLINRARALRPRLAQFENRIRAAESRVDLAKKDYFPDFNIGAVYGARQGNNPANIGGQRSDLLTVRVGINLPLYPARKRGSAVSQRANELQSDRYALQDEVLAVQAEISRATADYVQARDQFSLFATGIVPQARQTVASMLAGYQVSEVDFLNLVRSQITLFNYETEYWRALSAANQAHARLQAAVGGEISDE